MFYISEDYITSLNEEILISMEREISSTENLISYFQIHLFLCTRFNTNLLKYFLSTLQSLIDSSKLTFKDVYSIFHTKITYEDIQISCLNVAVLNRDEQTAKLLLQFEKILHQDETYTILRCIRENVRDDILKLKIAKQCKNQRTTDCLQDKFGINKKGPIFNVFMVMIETMVLSILPWLWDLVSDIQLCLQYQRISQIDVNSSSLILNEIATINTDHNESFIYDIYFPNFLNGSQVDANYSKLSTKYNTAYLITMCIIIANVLAFLIGACLGPPKWIETEIEKINKRLNRKEELESLTWYKIEDSRELKDLKSEKLYLKLISFQILSPIARIFWPILILMPHQYLNNVSTLPSKITKARFRTEILWKLVKIIETSLENVIQLGVQLYLIMPLLETLTKWSWIEIISSGFKGVLGIMSFGFYTTCSIDQTLGKIGFTIFGLSLGHTMMRLEKPGLSFTEKLLPMSVLFFSHLFQVVSRLLAIRNLMILEVSYMLKYIMVFLIHFCFVLAIKLMFDTRLKNEICPFKKPLKEFCWFYVKRLKRILLLLLSCACSLFVNVNLHRNTINLHIPKHSFLSQISFNLLIMLENLALTLLPFIAMNCYPDKYHQLSMVGTSWIVNSSWVMVIILEVNF